MLRKLKAKRVEKGITQEEMAEQLDICLTAYNFKENGINEFKNSEIKKILKILNTTYEEIFSEGE